jgi:hypothetical protein
MSGMVAIEFDPLEQVGAPDSSQQWALLVGSAKGPDPRPEGPPG